MINIQLAIALLLGIIAIKIYWLTTEIKLFKQRFNRTMLKTNLIECVILAAQILQAFYFPLPQSFFDKYIIALGIIMYLAGLILSLWARLTMNKVWGIPAEYSKNQTDLVTSGPFAFSRNPIYVGFLLLYFGFAIALRSWMIILRIPLLIYFYKSAKIEEKILEKNFGKKYLSYKARVPRFF